MNVLKPLTLLLIVLLAATARAQDAFESALDLDPVRYLSLQHNQTIKTFDSYSREVLHKVTGKSTLDKKPAAYTVLDMAFRPKEYVDRKLIYIRAKPFRADFVDVPFLDEAEKTRIVQEGTISLSQLLDPRMQAAMGEMMSHSTVKADAIRQIGVQGAQLALLLDNPNFRGVLTEPAIVPPQDGKDANDKPWQSVEAVTMHLFGSESHDGHDHAPLTPEYTDKVTKVIAAMGGLQQAWQARDASAANEAMTRLATATEAVNPAIYPAAAKRHFEVFYNTWFRLTLPGAALYCVSLLMFLLAWRAEIKWLYVGGWVFAVLGWLVHAAGIGIRWWLVEKSVGNWFESIPIKNQFESVLFSAFFGVTVGLALEAWKRHGIFGVATSAVGVLSLVAIFTAPYISGRDIGGDIKQNAGILMTYWLYIHVVLVVASYALIAMTFVLGVCYLIRLLMDRNSPTLKTLDDCNVVVLQLAFWVLGVGIVTGALWADVSWGRPWGWDPKETFALVTWIVYLIIVHVRFVTAGRNRAITTSVLSVIGFFVMLFNWIGVNFFLVGLHSYA